ncbi:NADH:flavin oxidoreductase/NADH oxidase [Zoogloea sp.]|uniref:NADH:flavin oxidoreductase/NADH oxidase n=1 Tax=Zoogloea sp. TaxID=49181 RepID=UPI0035B1844C
MSDTASTLFTPFTLGKLTLPNRIVIAPMCQYSADGDGNASDWHLIHLGSLALSGAGMLILEATAVSPEGRITPDCLGLWSDANAAALGRVLDGVRRHSAMPLAIQLAHAGRKASSAVPWAGGQLLSADEGGWTCVAPSALPYSATEPAPTALDADGLARIRDAFAAAARRAARIGLDCIELHGAHGYLLHEFLSPLSNIRDDAYGGSLENRMRFPLEVFDAVRAAFPAGRPVGMRISATDWVDGGWDLAQSVALAQALKARGCDFIHVSTGGLSPLQQFAVAPGFQVPFAAHIRRETGLPTVAVGLVTEAEQAEEIVANGQADLVGVARAMMYEPHWPWHAAARLGAQVNAPRQYWRSAPRNAGNLFAGARIGMR